MRLARLMALALLTLNLLLAASRTGEAQPAGKIARLAFLSNISLTADLRSAFNEGLHELGYRPELAPCPCRADSRGARLRPPW